MTTAKTSILALCTFLLQPAGVIAQEMTMADVKDPQKLTGDELRQVLTGAKVASKTRHGQYPDLGPTIRMASSRLPPIHWATRDGQQPLEQPGAGILAHFSN